MDGLQAELGAALERAERQPVEVPSPASTGDDDALRRTLVLAQRTADLAIKEAQEEADQLIERARAEAETTVGEAKRAAERITSEAERRLREEVARLTGARDDLRREVDTLMSLLAAERERLSESLGTALRYVERSLTPSPDFTSVPASAGREAPLGNRATPLPPEPASHADEPAPPADEPAVSVDEAPLAGGAAPLVADEPPLVGGAAPLFADEPRLAGGDAPRAAGESVPTGGKSAASGRGARTSVGSDAPVSWADEDATSARSEPPSWATESVSLRPEPASWTSEPPSWTSEPAPWTSEQPSERASAAAGSVGEFDEWDFDDDSGRAAAQDPRAQAGATPLFHNASRPQQLVAEVPSPAASVGPPTAGESWRSQVHERGLEGDELDDLEAAIAEDAAAAAPASGRYDDEFSWDARRLGRRNIPKVPERPNLTAVPALDDTMQDPRVWNTNSGPSDDPA